MHDIDLGGESESFEAMGEEESFAEAQLDEAEETELAAELLSVGSEAELDQFFGDLLKKVGSAVGSVIKPGGINLLSTTLKGLALKALPQLGSAIGGMVGGPTGGRIGGALASQAGRAFGLELEGLSTEEAEYETARHFCRFATDAVKNYMEKKPAGNPVAATRAALLDAAKRHAPGLVSTLREANGSAHQMAAGTQSGRWVRRGNKLIVIGA
jgi:hypothetical protein